MSQYNLTSTGITFAGGAGFNQSGNSPQVINFTGSLLSIGNPNSSVRLRLNEQGIGFHNGASLSNSTTSQNTAIFVGAIRFEAPIGNSTAGALIVDNTGITFPDGTKLKSAQTIAGGNTGGGNGGNTGGGNGGNTGGGNGGNTGGGTTPPTIPDWNRPVIWPSAPTFGTVENKICLIVDTTISDYLHISISATIPTTLNTDTIVVNIDNGASVFEFSGPNININLLPNKRFQLVTIYPKTTGHIAAFNLNTIPASSDYSSPIVEVSLSAPNMTGVINSLNLSNLVSFKVINLNKISQMLSSCKDCRLLENCEIGTVSSLNNVSSLLENCVKLTNFTANFSSVMTFSSLFEGCSSLTKLPDLNFSSALNLTRCFANCENLETLGLVPIRGGLLSYGKQDFKYMFLNCKNLDSIRLAGTGGSVGDRTGMFCGCINLTNITAPILTTEADNNSEIFKNCRSLKSTPLISLNKNCQDAFNGCVSLEAVNLVTPIFFNAITNATRMFKDCTSLTAPPILTFSQADTVEMFANCVKIRFLPNYNLTSVNNCQGMFLNCENLRNTSNLLFKSEILNASSMFENCKLLTQVTDATNSNISAIDASRMFFGCSSLETITNFRFTNGTSTFKNCTKLKNCSLRNLRNYVPTVHTLDLFYITTTEMFENCTSLTELNSLGNVLSLNIRFPLGVINADRMFNGCTNITRCVAVFANSAQEAYRDCINLIEIPAEPDTVLDNHPLKETSFTRNTNYTDIFLNCPKLRILQASTFASTSFDFSAIAFTAQQVNSFLDSILFNIDLSNPLPEIRISSNFDKVKVATISALSNKSNLIPASSVQGLNVGMHLDMNPVFFDFRVYSTVAWNQNYVRPIPSLYSDFIKNGDEVYIRLLYKDGTVKFREQPSILIDDTLQGGGWDNILSYLSLSLEKNPPTVQIFTIPRINSFTGNTINMSHIITNVPSYQREFVFSDINVGLAKAKRYNLIF